MLWLSWGFDNLYVRNYFFYPKSFVTRNFFDPTFFLPTDFLTQLFFGGGGVIYAPPGLTLLRTTFALTYVFLIVKTPTQPQHNLTQPEVGFDLMFG